jgi:hypothetical protein
MGVWRKMHNEENVIFWDVALYRFCMNRRFGGRKRLLTPTHAGSSLAEFSTLKMKNFTILILQQTKLGMNCVDHRDDYSLQNLRENPKGKMY